MALELRNETENPCVARVYRLMKNIFLVFNVAQLLYYYSFIVIVFIIIYYFSVVLGYKEV